MNIEKFSYRYTLSKRTLKLYEKVKLKKYAELKDLFEEVETELIYVLSC